MSRIYIARVNMHSILFQPVSDFSRIEKHNIKTARDSGIALSGYSDFNGSGDLLKAGFGVGKSIELNLETYEFEISTPTVITSNQFEAYKKAIRKAERTTENIEKRARTTLKQSFSTASLHHQIQMLFAEFNVVGGTIDFAEGKNQTFTYKPRTGSAKGLADNEQALDLILTALSM